MSLTVSINVLPSPGVRERQLIGHGSQNGSIFQMELMDIERPPASEEPPDAVNLYKCQLLRQFCGAIGLTGEIRARNGPGYLARGWK